MPATSMPDTSMLRLASSRGMLLARSAHSLVFSVSVSWKVTHGLGVGVAMMSETLGVCAQVIAVEGYQQPDTVALMELRGDRYETLAQWQT